MKLGALVPIRLGSSRLPKKALREIGGKPAVCHLLDRIFSMEELEPKSVIICTTHDPLDDELVGVVEKYGASCYRGDSDDLIKRLYNAMKQFDLDAAVQVDGDDIVAEPYYMSLTIKTLLLNPGVDCVSCGGLPIGAATKSFTRNAMENVFSKYLTKNNDTGFGSYFTETSICNHIILPPCCKKHVCDRVRLTLDYEEDLIFFSALFDEFKNRSDIFHLEDIVELVATDPEIAEINWFLQDEYMKRFHSMKKVEYTS